MKESIVVVVEIILSDHGKIMLQVKENDDQNVSSWNKKLDGRNDLCNPPQLTGHCLGNKQAHSDVLFFSTAVEQENVFTQTYPQNKLMIKRTFQRDAICYIYLRSPY